MKEQPRTRSVKIVVLNPKMKRLQIPQKIVYEKFYVHEIAAVNLSKIYFLKDARKARKRNNRDLDRD